MGTIRVEVLSPAELRRIHDASLRILERTGVKVHHDECLELLEAAGASVDRDSGVAHLPEKLVLESIARAGKRYALYGREGDRSVPLGGGEPVLMSSPGQYGWMDLESGTRRKATLEDAREAIRLGDALPGIGIVGAMAQPAEVSEKHRDVVLTAELLKGTTKPTRAWLRNGWSARYVLELYRAVAGGERALREQPMVEAFLEPISPLQLPRDGLDIVKELARAGQPVSVGPMAMAAGTAPGTLAGTLAQENAEILAGVVATQLFAPGAAMTYGGIPHILDPRTSICSFGSPEQGLMAVAMVQMARSYGFPVYVNVGLTDAKLPDAQAGIEKAGSFVLGLLAGADTFGHCGICGTDHAGSLVWLALDDELFQYARRVQRGFRVNQGTLAADVIGAVGPAGHFLSEQHTVEHFRRELWLPSAAWTRQSYEAWEVEGRPSFADRLVQKVGAILSAHAPHPIDEALARELDRIVACAAAELT